MIVDNLLVMLRTVYQTVGADFVDDSSDTGRVSINFSKSGVRKDLTGRAGILQMLMSVGVRLSPVIVVKAAADIEALPDSGVDLAFEKIPEFGLSDKDERHRAL